MKKASDYIIGERFLEDNHRDAGSLVSLAVDPARPTRAYLLVRSDNGGYTIFSCLRDAVCRPSLAREIPELVMRKFLFDAYTEGEELRYDPGENRKVPVRLPEFKVRLTPAETRSEPDTH